MLLTQNSAGVTTVGGVVGTVSHAPWLMPCSQVPESPLSDRHPLSLVAQYGGRLGDGGDWGGGQPYVRISTPSTKIVSSHPDVMLRASPVKVSGLLFVGLDSSTS